MNNQSALPEPPPGCPAHNSGQRVPLYGPEFAAKPDAYYAHLRQYGPVAPVELAPGVEATLVTSYAAALQVLQNPDTFAKDSRRWRALNEGRVPQDSPVLALIGYRPNALFADGADHMRLRQAVTHSLGSLDSHHVSRQVERITDYLIDQFSARGSADLLNDYAKLVPLLVFNELIGCPAEIGDRLVSGLADLFDGINVEKANAEVTQSLLELIAVKRQQPGADITSWLMEHPSRLSDEEMIHQLVLLMGAGTEPQQNLIANAFHLLLTEDSYANDQHGGGLLVEDAIDDVLWNSPPIANYAVHYPIHDTEIAGITLRAGDPVMISFAAANTDPAVSAPRQLSSKRAHLAWGAGPHACPAKDPARLIALTALEKLLNRLPDVELAVPADTLTWRPGCFHRALTALPTRFTPAPAEKHTLSPASPEDDTTVSTQAPAHQKPQKAGFWSSFLTWWKA
jgi:cytochrome P450